MAYKQPRVPSFKEDMQLAAYMRELILFLKDFSLETWAAVRALQGKQKTLPEEEEEAQEQTVTLDALRTMLDGQAQTLRGEMAQGISQAKREAIDGALPVGIVISFADATDPGALYPWQVWTQIVDGRVEIAANAAHPLGSTGGEETHALTVDEMPSHSHAISDGFWNYQQGAYGYPGSVYKSSTTPVNKADWDVTKTAGGSQAHNNMPPYVARNKRMAENGIREARERRKEHGVMVKDEHELAERLDEPVAYRKPEHDEKGA